LQHTFNIHWQTKFLEGIKICEEYLGQKKNDFETLQDRIDTTFIPEEEENKNKEKEVPRESLPVGINLVSTKKYIDWVKKNPAKRIRYLSDYSHEFWFRFRNDLLFWNEFWADPLSTDKKRKLNLVPADLRVAILKAKCSGALALFPKSGCYVGEWTIRDKEKEKDWNLGLHSFIPRYAHQKMLEWKGLYTTKSEQKQKEKPFIAFKKSHYRQSFISENEIKYNVDVVDENGNEMGFNAMEEWIVHYCNEPPPGKNSNLMAILLPEENCITTYTSQEIQPNEECFLYYFKKFEPTIKQEKEEKEEEVSNSYPIGNFFKETRRRLYFFLPGQALRNWISQSTKNQQMLAQYLRIRLYQHYYDDFSWRQFQAPSSFSYLKK
jgi:hypothetical protein